MLLPISLAAEVGYIIVVLSDICAVYNRWD